MSSRRSRKRPHDPTHLMALDTLEVARRLREAWFTEPQAEAVLAAIQDAAAGADLATKADVLD